jgi:hypothetical protein
LEKFKAAIKKVRSTLKPEKLRSFALSLWRWSSKNPDHAKIAKSMVDFLKGFDKVCNMEADSNRHCFEEIS